MAQDESFSSGVRTDINDINQATPRSGHQTHTCRSYDRSDRPDTETRPSQRQQVLFRHYNQSFLDPNYVALNPNYDRLDHQPVWGLARPLPRIVRPGMVSRRTRTHSSASGVARCRIQDVDDRAIATQQYSTAESTSHLVLTAQQPDIQADLLNHPLTLAVQHGNTFNRNDTVLVPKEKVLDAVSATRSRLVRVQEQRMGMYGHAADSLNQRQSHLAAGLSLTDLSKVAVRRRTNQSRSSEQYITHDRNGSVDQSTSEDPNRCHERAINTIPRRFQDNRNPIAEHRSGKRASWNTDWMETQSKDTSSSTRYQPHTDSLQRTNIQIEEQECKHHNRWAELRYTLRKPLAEFLGTFITITIGLACSVVQQTGKNEHGNIVTTSLGWGFGVMMGIYTCGGISGAHLNPTVSIVIWIFRGFPGITCLQYIVAQLLACFCAAAVVFSLYHDTIIHTNKSLVLGGTGVAFYTQPQEWISNITAFFTEVVATGILLCCVLALGDDGNTPPGAGMQALVTGLLVSALCMAFSYNTGACLNPARDLGPRLFALVAGYGKQVFTSRNFWWIWGPWGATITGGVLGAFFYDLLVFNGGESPINFPGEHWEDLWCDTKAFFEAARAGFQWRGFRSRGSESRDEERCGDMYL